MILKKLATILPKNWVSSFIQNKVEENNAKWSVIWQKMAGCFFLLYLKILREAVLNGKKTIYKLIADDKHCNTFFSIPRRMECCQFIVQMQLRLLKTYNCFSRNQFFILMN